MLKQSWEETVIISDAIESILEAYFERYSEEIVSLIELYSKGYYRDQNNANSEPKHYERGIDDVIFLIYAANNREDFEDILKSYCEDSGTTDLKVLRRIYRESNAEFTDENGIALVGDCKKLSTSEVTVLKLEMAKFLKEKCNQYLSENYKERFKALENDFDAHFNAALQPSSESDQSSESDKKKEVEVRVQNLSQQRITANKSANLTKVKTLA